jgi:hypothetical protein
MGGPGRNDNGNLHLSEFIVEHLKEGLSDAGPRSHRHKRWLTLIKQAGRLPTPSMETPAPLGAFSQK